MASTTDDIVVKIKADVSSFNSGVAQARTASVGLEDSLNKVRAASNSVAPAVNSFSNALRGNQMLMMSMRAHAVNTFQALAAGISPMRVLSIEGAQVIGTFAQFGESLGTLLFPIGAVAAGIGYAILKLRDMDSANAAAIAAETAYQKSLKTTGEVLDTLAQKTKAASDEKFKAAIANAQLTITKLGEQAKELEAQIATPAPEVPGAVGSVMVSAAMEDAKKTAQAQLDQVHSDLQRATDTLVRIQQQAATGSTVEQAAKTQTEAHNKALETQKKLYADIDALAKSMGDDLYGGYHSADKALADLNQKEQAFKTATSESLQSQIADNDKLIAALGKGTDAYDKEKESLATLDKFKAAHINLTDQEIAGYTKLTNTIADQRSQIQLLKDSQAELANFAQHAFTTIGDAITQAFVQGQGAGVTFRNVMLAILSQIEQKFLELAALNPILNALGLSGKSPLPTLGSVFSALFGGGPVSSIPNIGAGATAGGDFFMMAEGGIMTSRGPLPLKHYASGGVANTPQLAMFGEGSTPEAYVPLKSGAIPVKMSGGGAPVVVNVHNHFALGVTNTVRAEVMNMLPLINASASRAVQNARARNPAYFGGAKA